MLETLRKGGSGKGKGCLAAGGWGAGDVQSWTWLIRRRRSFGMGHLETPISQSKGFDRFD